MAVCWHGLVVLCLCRAVVLWLSSLRAVVLWLLSLIDSRRLGTGVQLSGANSSDGASTSLPFVSFELLVVQENVLVVVVGISMVLLIFYSYEDRLGG